MKTDGHASNHRDYFQNGRLHDDGTRTPTQRKFQFFLYVWNNKRMEQRGSKLFNMKPLRHYTDAALYEAFLPFFIGMKLFGLFHNKEYADAWKYGCEYRKEECPRLRKRITP